MEKVHTSPKYHKFAPMTMKEINNGIIRNEAVKTRNGVRIRKLDGIYKRNLESGIRQEVNEMWKHQEELAKRYPVLTACDHDHEGEHNNHANHGPSHIKHRIF